MSGEQGGQQWTRPVRSAEVAEWHVRRFGKDPDIGLALGKLTEEVGELAGAIVKRAEGAVRPDKGLVTWEDWTRHLLEEMGDVVIALNLLASLEGRDLNDLGVARFRYDVMLRPGQEVRRFSPGDRVRSTADGRLYRVTEAPQGLRPAGAGRVWVEPEGALGPPRPIDAASLLLLNEPAGSHDSRTVEPPEQQNPPGVCRSCGQGFSPTHDIDAPGPTVRHPFIAKAYGPGQRGE